MKMAYLPLLLRFPSLYFGVHVLVWGLEGNVLVISAVCFTKLLLLVGLGGSRKSGGLNSGQSCNFR